jgi:hypothetical protein
MFYSNVKSTRKRTYAISGSEDLRVTKHVEWLRQQYKNM